MATKRFNKPEKRAKVICIANPKSGVGKTTTAVNLGAGLARRGLRTLVIDLDPRGVLARAFGVRKLPLISTYNVLVRGTRTTKGIIAYRQNLDLLLSTPALDTADSRLGNRSENLHVLKKALRRTVWNYDYILIDTPPAEGLLSKNALVASTDILFPTICESDTIENVSKFLAFVQEACPEDEINRVRILLTRSNPRRTYELDIWQELQERYYGYRYDAVIIEDACFQRAFDAGRSVYSLDKECQGVTDYEALVCNITGHIPSKGTIEWEGITIPISELEEWEEERKRLER